MSDAYAWTVHYRDGSTYAQINEAGEDVGGWAHVQADQVAIIRLEPLIEGLPLHSVKVPDGATAFLTWRRTNELVLSTGEQITHPGLLIVGWFSSDEESYLFIDQLGNTMMARRRDDI